MIKLYSIVLLYAMIFTRANGQEKIFSTQAGTISFTSEVPLEMISAASKKMEGVVDATALSFAVTIRTFEGFNNGLQQQHFYENYLETDKYPIATPSGKIIEHVDLSKRATFQVRAKGQLNIQGRAKERIIKIEIISTGAELNVSTQFLVPLVDHQIEVPRIVNQKIAQEINVSAQAILSLSVKP
ncbi:MAG: YceI family protein [Saprospiraceae bacterium]|nr:YceI family protein [Saprospiraceae bacterium]